MFPCRCWGCVSGHACLPRLSAALRGRRHLGGSWGCCFPPARSLPARRTTPAAGCPAPLRAAPPTLEDSSSHCPRPLTLTPRPQDHSSWGEPLSFEYSGGTPRQVHVSVRGQLPSGAEDPLGSGHVHLPVGRRVLLLPPAATAGAACCRCRLPLLMMALLRCVGLWAWWS